MIYPVKTNLIPLLKNLVAAIQQFAKANFVHLQFETDLEKAEVTYHPETLIPDLTQLLCRVITFTPQEHKVTLEVKEIHLGGEKFLQLRVMNTGVNLEYLKDIVSGIRREITVVGTLVTPGFGSIDISETVFDMRFPLEQKEEVEGKVELVSSYDNKKYIILPFFKKLKEHLRSHFTSIQNLEKAASARSVREGVFLKKVNAVIIANLDREGFDTASLSKAMALSRSQLYRRLKPLIRLPPSHYIRYVRLQKAKEFIEKEDLSIGEVAFRTGFVSQSHFTRVFREQFGFNPSDLKQ